MRSTQKNITVALLAFIDIEGRILLNCRREETTRMWELIGGGVEDGEVAIDAIRREVSEELCYHITPEDNLQFVKEFHFENDRYAAHVSFFTATFPGMHVFSDSDEMYVDDLALFAVSEALELPLLPIAHDILENTLAAPLLAT